MRILLLLLFWGIALSITTAQTSIKRMEQDSKFDNRTNVVKEEGIDDLTILNEQFSDARPGQVVRINIEKIREKKPKEVKEKKQREVKPKVEKPKATPKPKPTPVKVTPEKPATPKPPAKVTKSNKIERIGSDRPQYKASRKKLRNRFKVKRKKRKRGKRGKASCYFF